MPTWRATPRQLPPPGLGTGNCSPPAAAPGAGLRPTCNFWGPSGGGREGGRDPRGGQRSAARPAPPLPPARRQRPLRLLSCRATPALGSDFAGGDGRAVTLQPRGPGPGAAETSERRRGRPGRAGGAGPTCPGVTCAPEGSGAAAGLRKGGRSPVGAGAGRAATQRPFPGGAMRALTGGGRTLQMPVCSAMGRILWMKAKGSANSSQLGSKTGHSGGGRNSAMARAGGRSSPPPLRTILQQPLGRRAPLERDVRLRREGWGGANGGGGGGAQGAGAREKKSPPRPGRGEGAAAAPPRHAPL